MKTISKFAALPFLVLVMAFSTLLGCAPRRVVVVQPHPRPARVVVVKQAPRHVVVRGPYRPHPRPHRVVVIRR